MVVFVAVDAVVVVAVDVVGVLDVGVVVAEVVPVEVSVDFPHASAASFPAMYQLMAAFSAATPELHASTGNAKTAPTWRLAVWSLFPSSPALLLNLATSKSISNDAVRPFVRSLRTVNVPLAVCVHCTVAEDAADAAVPSIVLKHATSSLLKTPA